MKRIAKLLLLATAVLGIGAVAASAQETKLTGYLIGSAPAGLPEVLDALNAKLKADIGVTTEINYIGWGDLNSRYPLVLAAGEGLDWIYTAEWCQYAPQSVRGAFKELTLDMIKKYMPRHFAATPAAAWEQVKINGKIFMIPTSTPDKKVPVIVIRGDLRKKYKVPEVKSFADIEPYLAAIKKNEASMIPMNLDNGYDLGQPFGAVLNQYAPPSSPIQLSNNATGSPFIGNFEDPTCTPYSQASDKPYADAYRKTVKQMKAWYDKGYFNKNPFANTVMSRDSFTQGKSGVAFGNSQNIQETLANAKAAGFEPELIPNLASTGHYPADPFTNNGVAIAANSKNVEKTLAFLDLIMEEPSYDYLIYFGVEGKHWVLTKDGKIGLPEGVAADKTTYPWDAAGVWFMNKDIQKPLANWSDDYIALRAKMKTMLYNSSFTGFTFTPEKVKTEVSNLNAVWAQYANPLNVGITANADKSVDDLVKKLKSAGLDKVQAEIKSQVAEFLAAKKK